MLTPALVLAERGFSVFPLQACSKEPYPKTRGFVDASKDPEQIRKWWGIAPSSNIGLNPPDGVIVLDVDPRNDGDKTLAKLEADNGPLPDTLTAKTGGGGLHAFFRVPAGLAWPKELADGIDIKSHRGYVLAAPSVHDKTGQLYEWLTPLETPIADAPAWVLAKSRPQGEDAQRVIVEDDERTTDDSALDALVEELRPHFVDGKKHYLCKALGGWLKQRGLGFDDVAYVIRKLLEPLGINPTNGITAARWAFGVDKPFGWHELRGLIGEAPAAALDSSAPNPRRDREVEERAAAADLVPALVAGAVQSAPTPMMPVGPGAPSTFAQRLSVLGRVDDLSKPAEPLVYLCRGLGIAPGKITGLSGYPGTGKGPFLALLALCLAAGMPFLGMPVARARTVLWDLETGPLAKTRLMRLANAVGVNVGELERSGQLFLIHGSPPIAAAHLDQVRALAMERSIDAVLFDSYTSGVPGDANVQDHAKIAWDLGAISNATGVTIIGTTHEKKRQDRKRGGSDLEMQAGSFALSAAQQTTVSLTRPDDNDRNLIEVRCARAPEEGFDPFRFRWEDVLDPGHDDSPGSFLSGSRAWGLRAAIVSRSAPTKSPEEIAREHAQKMLTVKPQVLGLLAAMDPNKRGMTTDQLRKQLQVAKDDVTDACDELANETPPRLIRGKDGHARPYHLPRTEREQWAIDHRGTPYIERPASSAYAPPPIAVGETLRELGEGLHSKVKS